MNFLQNTGFFFQPAIARSLWLHFCIRNMEWLFFAQKHCPLPPPRGQRWLIMAIFTVMNRRKQRGASMKHPYNSAKWSQIFMKLSAYLKIGLLSWLIMLAEIYDYSHLVCRMQIACLCACTDAHAHLWTLLISSGDQSWHMLKVSWRSDFIWLIYEGLYTAPSCMPVFRRCACKHAHAHPGILMISPREQSWRMLKVSWISDFL